MKVYVRESANYSFVGTLTGRTSGRYVEVYVPQVRHTTWVSRAAIKPLESK